MKKLSRQRSESPESNGWVLILTPDKQLTTAIRAALREAAPTARVDVGRSLEEAQRLVIELAPDLFVLDMDAGYDLGQEFLYDLRTSHPHARAIILATVHQAAHREEAAGLGAIHFLEKPFPHRDFVDLVVALLHSPDKGGEKFQGTLSDLHIVDIIQLKCLSGATSVLEFTGPRGEKARVFFENGQVRHATAPGKEGMEAFNEIVHWKGGKISEVPETEACPHTIDFDWQVLLMEAVRKLDESLSVATKPAVAASDGEARRRSILVLDDSLMLLNFVETILTEANYDVVTAPTAARGLRAAAEKPPDLILLDFILPDMQGDAVLARLLENEATARVPVIYMSGFGTDLPSDPKASPNVIGSLHKPFTSELLLKTVETHMPNDPETKAPEMEQPPEPGWEPVDQPETITESMAEAAPLDPAVQETVEQFSAPPDEMDPIEMQAGGTHEAWWEAPPAPEPWAEEFREEAVAESAPPSSDDRPAPAPAVPSAPSQSPLDTSSAFFCGDTRFFSLNWALHTIAAQKLTGTLRAFWNKEPVELLARNGQVLLATTRDPDLYCSEAPITLVNIDRERTERARQQQRETGRPLFVTLAQEGLVIREPALQLVQHYGQKLFAQLWTAPLVRFMFDQSENLPQYAQDLPAEDDVDHWALSTLRFIQFPELDGRMEYDPASVPAYTRDGFERVQRLRLTVAEAQFASQFNGTRSIAQIAKNLRLDLKFARLTLFRFVALEIIDCWPPAAVAAKKEQRGLFGRIFGG